MHIQERMVCENSNRKDGKTHKYKLGTIHQHKDYLLTALSRFDEKNRAYLSMQDYVTFLLEFWNEIDIIYAGKTIVIPLLGSGMTRFKNVDISEQELLELLLWSFKMSRIKFRYPSKVRIVISKNKKDRISLYKLKEYND